MHDEITSLLWSPDYVTALAIAFFLAGTAYAIPSISIAFAMQKSAVAALIWQRRLAIAATALFAAATVLFLALEGAEADREAATLIELASIPQDRRMIQVMVDGSVVVSERSSAVTERGQLVNFERNHVRVPANLFPEVWRLAGGNVVQPGKPD